MTFIFENCDSLSVPDEDIQYFRFDGISKSIFGGEFYDNGTIVSETCDSFEIILNNKVLESKTTYEKDNNLKANPDLKRHLNSNGDITSILHENRHIHPPWNESDDQWNSYQNCEFDFGEDEFRIVIKNSK
ncbi:MAG: hypothetical protein PHQ74_15320 [Crocinitomicaceae bacterium]|nr:hypothetical protein [Crocinitomicaceae bacterium]